MRWEYKIIELSNHIGDRSREFEALGALGWECFSISGGWAYFKRPVKESVSRETSVTVITWPNKWY